MNEKSTTPAEEHADSIREFIRKLEKPSGFPFVALTRLEEEIRSRDATISVLVNALVLAMTPGVPLANVIERGTAALRLAGR